VLAPGVTANPDLELPHPTASMSTESIPNGSKQLGSGFTENSPWETVSSGNPKTAEVYTRNIRRNLFSLLLFRDIHEPLSEGGATGRAGCNPYFLT
jgi:hypothetical protein